MTGDYDPYERLDPVPAFDVDSDDVADGVPFRTEQFAADCGGSDTSPELRWSGFPAETKSFALTMYDPDAPTGSGFWHWAVFDIRAGTTSLPAGAGSPERGRLPGGAITLPNELRQQRYAGAAPPEGTGTHRYYVVVHAVDTEHLGVDPQSTPAVLGFKLHFHTLGRAIIVPTGTFGGA